MKIGISGFELGHIGGTTIYLVNLLKQLAELDTENKYAIWTPKGAARTLPTLSDRFQVIPVTNQIRRTIPSIAWHNAILPFHARTSNCDFIHIPHLCRVPLVKSTPVIATLHDMTAFTVAGRTDHARVFYHREILSRLVFRCDRVIAVSKHTADDLVRFTGFPRERITTIYSGIDHDTYRPMDPAAAKKHLKQQHGVTYPFLLYVARLEYFKNHLNLIRAFELFKKRYGTDHHLILAGADDIGARDIKSQAAASIYRNQIHFLGSVPVKDVVALNTACELMVFPSFYESFGLAIYEAMACGALAICSDGYYFRDIPDNCAQKFNPQDVESICDSIASALQDPNRDRRITEAKALASSFQWSTTAREVLGVYQNMR